MKDFGLPEFVNRLTPLVEVAWSSPASQPNQGSTQYLIAPGINYTAADLRGHGRGVDPRQQADRLACRGDRAVPSLFRRSVSEQPRQADRELVELMRCAALIGLAMLVQASPVFAHAFLERASPPVGSEVTVSPPELSITFTEGVEPLFSTIAVHGANGAAIATGKPHVAPDSNRRLIVELPKLPPGTYTVNWHVTSVDTHKTEGNYKFTVAH